MAEIKLDKAHAGRSLSVACGDTVVVRLDETPTSGYRWEVAEIDPAVLKLASDDFVPASGTTRGGGGHHEFRFEVVTAGKSPLRLIRRRPWEPASAAVEELGATVNSSG